MTTLSYNLGKTAHKKGKACEATEDKVFMLYLKNYNKPLILCVSEYVRGYYDRKTKIDVEATTRRLQFTLV